MSLLDALARGGWLRPLDHALALSLRRLAADTPDAAASDAVLAAAALASRAVAAGHGALALARVPALLEELAPERALPALPEPADWAAQLRASPWVAHLDVAAATTPGVPLVLEGELLFLRRYRDYEHRLAHALRARSAGDDTTIASEALRARLHTLFPALLAGPDAQALAAAVALWQRFSLITGGPGTGKTRTVARLLVLAVEQALQAGQAPPRIALAAPTGKAAARLAESIRADLDALAAAQQVSAVVLAAVPTRAQTLHRLLGWQPGRIDFRHDAAHPLAYELLVVDEASMVDLPLMCKLVEAVPASASLVLLGDRDQLPSVETGDVLAALCDAAGDGLAFPPAQAQVLQAVLGRDVASGDATGVLSGHRVQLQRVYRQTPQLQLAPLAGAIRDGDADAALSGLHAQTYAGVRWQAGRDAALPAALAQQALPFYRTLRDAATPAEALRAARGFRLLTAVRDGAAGSNALNAQLEAALQSGRRERCFHGRLLLITENSDRHGLFNGDIGICWRGGHDADDADTLQVWFEGEDGAPRAWLPSALPGHESAFAMTVHMAQGSEFEQVWLVLPERGARVLSRELLYTGLTRARDGVALWATEPVLRDAIGRRAQRASGLAARLHGS